jgi:hypothetical protein
VVTADAVIFMGVSERATRLRFAFWRGTCSQAQAAAFFGVPRTATYRAGMEARKLRARTVSVAETPVFQPQIHTA